MVTYDLKFTGIYVVHVVFFDNGFEKRNVSVFVGRKIVS